MLVIGPRAHTVRPYKVEQFSQYLSGILFLQKLHDLK